MIKNSIKALLRIPGILLSTLPGGAPTFHTQIRGPALARLMKLTRERAGISEGDTLHRALLVYDKLWEELKSAKYVRLTKDDLPFPGSPWNENQTLKFKDKE